MILEWEDKDFGIVVSLSQHYSFILHKAV